MRKVAGYVLTFCVGSVVGWMTGTDPRTTGAPDPIGARIDLTTDFTVQHPGGSTTTYSPHCVMSGTRRVHESPVPDRPVTVFWIDGGRIKVGCTQKP